MNGDHETIVEMIISYTELLDQISTAEVALWTVDFIAKCKDWCICIETELGSMDQETSQAIRKKAQEKAKHTIPVLSQLLEATHHFFYQLLQSIYLPNDVYLFIMKNYQFLTSPQVDTLTKVRIT
jgi:hypothetical protein